MADWTVVIFKNEKASGDQVFPQDISIKSADTITFVNTRLNPVKIHFSHQFLTGCTYDHGLGDWQLTVAGLSAVGPLRVAQTTGANGEYYRCSFGGANYENDFGHAPGPVPHLNSRNGPGDDPTIVIS